MNESNKRVNDFFSNKNIECIQYKSYKSYKSYKLYKNHSGKKIKVRKVLSEKQDIDPSVYTNINLGAIAVPVGMITYSISLDYIYPIKLILDQSYSLLIVVGVLTGLLYIVIWFFILKGILNMVNKVRRVN